MLFRALLTRLCGGTNLSHERATESRRRFAKATYNRYPGLADIITRLLKISIAQEDNSHLQDNSRKIQVAFPALEIVEKVGVPSSHSTTIQTLLLDQLGNECWKLREKAARALCLMAEPPQLLEELEEGTKDKPMPMNRLHGVLLCLKYLYEMREFQAPGMVIQCTLLYDLLNLAEHLLPLKRLLDLRDLISALSSSPFAVWAYWDACTSLLHRSSSFEGMQ